MSPHAQGQASDRGAPEITDATLNWINEDIVMGLQESSVAAPPTTILNGKHAIRVYVTDHRSALADFDFLVDEAVNFLRAMVGRV